VRSCQVLLLVSCVAACKNDAADAPAEKATEPTRKLAGVYPEDFKCETVTSVADLGQALGGAVRVTDSPMSPPKGIAHTCSYEVDLAGAVEAWSWDADCRDGAIKRADALFTQYREDSAALVQQYNVVSDAGIKPTDAGVSMHAPGAAVEVQVGTKALDHHGQGLLFVDDDAPCYVRIVGPDAGRRLELARLVAKNLTFANAPMTPRPMK
jgi:hypothetical protein